MQITKMATVRNNLLLFTAVIFVFSSILISLNILYKPFSSTDQLYVSGRTLYIKLQQPKDIEKVIITNQKLISLEVGFS